MLLEIYISNFVLIDNIRLTFQPGLTVLSGETGAGKSIVIDALGLILGERAQQDLVRDSTHRAIAEATFEVAQLPELQSRLAGQGHLDKNETIVVLGREIVPGGKSLARLNGRVITAGALREISALLLDMHLQHDHLSILKPQMYLQYLDSSAPESTAYLQEVGDLYRLLSQHREELLELQQKEKAQRERLDFLLYQIDEIEKADLRADEEGELEQVRQRLRDAEKLAHGLQQLLLLLYEQERAQGGNVYDLISLAVQTASSLGTDPFFASLESTLIDISFKIEEMAGSLSAYRYTLDGEHLSLDEVESRLDLIQRLKSLYGHSISEVLAYLEQAKKEVETLQGAQSRQENLTRDIAKLQQKYMAAAGQLSQIREKAALKLEEQVHQQLLELNLPQVLFKVGVHEKEASATGINQVELCFSANPGEEPKPLHRIASGGEISRFVLALKIVLAGIYRVPTLVFDEIDAGVGGSSLVAMARKIAALAQHYQVLMVTHAPHIASVSQQHYLISKELQDERTLTKVTALDEAARIQEIARMLAGNDVSPLTLQHARQIYSTGQQYIRG